MLDLFEFRLVYFILYRLSVEYLPKVRGAMMAVFPSYPEEAPRDPKEFERFCARLLWEKGYRDVRWVGRPGDMSLDIICRGLTERGLEFNVRGILRRLGSAPRRSANLSER